MEKVLRQINLARGWPSLENLRRVAPLVQKWSAASLQAACESDEAAGSLFGYCSTCPVVQRDFEISLKDFMSRNGYGSRDKVDRLSITLTPGGSYAIDVCTRQAIVDLGKRDVALVESPTYYLADRIFGEHNLEVVGVDSDECGLVPESLEDMLIRLKNEGKTVQILYTIPGHHNPTSCTLSDERRKRIVELSQKYDFYIIADEVYQSLSFQDHEFPPSLATLDKRVFSVSSFSKIISPGMRLGWISTEAQVTVGKGVFESGGNISSYTAAMIHPGLESREIDKHLSIIRSDLYLRAKTLYTALQQALGDKGKLFSFAEPQGGFFLWLEVSPVAGFTTSQFAEEVSKRNVTFKIQDDGLRLCFAYEPIKDLQIAATRIADAANACYFIAKAK